MLVPGDRVPKATIWTAPHQRSSLDELLADGPALFILYLFDWSST